MIEKISKRNHFPRSIEHSTVENDQPIRKNVWMRALKKASIKYRNPYQTRDTFASTLLSKRLKSHMGSAANEAQGLGNDYQDIWTMDTTIIKIIRAYSKSINI